MFLSEENHHLIPLKDVENVLLNVLKPFGKEYTDSVHKLIKEGHIDALSHEEKASNMVFSWDTHTFFNYKEDYESLRFLIHEIGHNINDLKSKNEIHFYETSSDFIGETAALVNELLLNIYYIQKSSSKKEIDYYKNQLQDNILMQVYRSAFYTEFELNLIHKKENLTCSEVNEIYKNTFEIFFPNVTLENSFDWIQLGKLFRAPLSSLSYSISFIVAIEIIEKLEDKSLTPETYNIFLAQGRRNRNEELLKILGIDLNDGDIFKKTENFIKRFL